MTQAEVNEFLQQMENDKAKARKNPFKLIRISYKNFYIYNDKCDTLFQIIYNEERTSSDKWDLRDVDAKFNEELIDAYKTKSYAVNVVNKWHK